MGRFRRLLLPCVCAVMLLPVCGGLPAAGTQDVLAAPPVARQAEPSWPIDASIFPFSGTAETTGDSLPNTILPPSTAHDVGHRQTIVEWAVADATHFRVTFHRLEPILASGTTDFVANGGPLISYSEGAASAERLPLTADTGVATINALLSTGVIRPLARSVVGYLAAYVTGHKGVHATLTGQEQVLGRTADVIDVHPIYSANESSCTSDSSGKQHCVTHRHSYGKARIWIDDEHLIVLKVQFSGIPDRYGGNFEYHLTSVHFGQGPSAADLASVPAVPLQEPPSTTGSSGSGEVSIGSAWHAPPPFIDVGPPSGAKGAPFMPVSVSEEHDALHGGPVGIAVVFAAKRPVALRTPAGASRVKGAYLYLQERIRDTGPPAWQTMGTQTTAGTCTVWTGDFSDHVHWLGLTRGDVSLLASSRSLNRAALIRYAATQICAHP